MKKIYKTMMTAVALGVMMASCAGETELPPFESPWGDPVGNGTSEAPFNCSAAVNKCVEIGQTASTDWYFITGYVVGGTGIEPSYGNATFLLADEPDKAGIFTAYHVRNFDYKKFTEDDVEEGKEVVKIGDKITIYAPIFMYGGKTPETNGGFLYSVNDVEGGSVKIVVDNEKYPPVKEGEGTLESPFNVAQAVAKCQETGQTATSQEYYITGYVTFGGDGIDTNYGNATFSLSDVRFGGGSFTAYRIYDEGGKKFTDADKVRIGDRITVCGKLVNFRGNTPETNQGGKLVSVESFSESNPQ